LRRDKETPASRTRNYNSDLSRAQRNCTGDIIAAVAMLMISAAALVWAILGNGFPETVSVYRYAAGSAAISAMLYFALKTAQAISRKRACKEIVSGSVYAVRLNEEQQKLISRVLARQSVREHFLCYALMLAVLAVILVLSYVRRGNSSALLVLSASAVLGFAVTLIAYIRDIVRTSSKDGFCTVSARGIIQAGKVFPFRSEYGDVLEIIRFDDCYAVRFVTGGVLGVLSGRDFPLPKGGSVSREHFGEEEEPVLLSALRPLAVRTMSSPYRQLPIEHSASEHVSDTETPAMAPDDSVFLRITACAALAILIIAAFWAAGNS
jgi:hypothetical protein